MSDKKLVIPESMVARMMELAGNKALFKKSILKESSEDPEKKEEKKEEKPSGDSKKSAPPKESKSSEPKPSAPPSSDPGMEEEEAETGLDVDGDDEFGEGGDDDVLNDDLIDSDVGGFQDETESLDATQFVDALADLITRHFGVEVNVSSAMENEEEVGGFDDIESEGGDELGGPEFGAEEEGEELGNPGMDEGDVGLPPTITPEEDSLSNQLPESKISPVARQIYESLMRMVVKKNGVNIQESKSANREVSVKLTEKKQMQKKTSLNEGTNPQTGQPHKKGDWLDKTVKGKPGKPAKESPAPSTKKYEKVTPKKTS